LWQIDETARANKAVPSRSNREVSFTFAHLSPLPTRFGIFIMTSSTKEIASNNKDRNDWQWGFTPQAELWNGRFAMLGFIAALLTEWFSGDGILHFYNLMHYMNVATR
jgi:hypothetical protein